MKLNRREFLKTAAAATMGIAALQVTGYASAADADTESPVSDWLGSAPEIADSEIAETVDVDVLVVGDGNSGAFAAAAAVEEGVKVLIIDKAGAGYGIRTDLGALNSKLMQGAGIDYDKFEMIQEFCNYAASECDVALLRRWTDNSGTVIDWYQEVLAQYDVTEHVEHYEGNAGGHMYWSINHGNPNMHGEDSSSNLIRDYVKGLGGEYRYGTSLVKLIVEEDVVKGVIAQDILTESYIRINASKGVIIATGGYAYNMDMMQALQPATVPHYSRYMAPPTNVGDGIKACLWAGADMDDIHTSMLFDRCALPPDGVSGPEYLTGGTNFWMGSHPFMKVNLNGERFVNESCLYDYVLHAASYHPGNCYCTIWDSNYEAHLRQFDLIGCARAFATTYFDGEKDFPSNDGSAVSYMITMTLNMCAEAGYLQQADSFEELAEKLNIPAEAFAEQVKLYNEMCEKGVDEQFGKEASRMIKLDTPPYYGIRQTGSILCTLDGIRINANMQALDKEQKAIPGLYVVGNDSGGFFAHTYPNNFRGIAAGRSATFGRIAGKAVCGVEL